MELDSGRRSSAASVTEPDPMSQRPQSPDYSPSLLRLLGTVNSSSGESFQSYLARKLVDRGEGEEVSKIGEPGSSSRQNLGSKTNVSDAITITPAVNSSTDIPGLSATTPVVTFLGPPGLSASQTESERSRSSTKRPRAGSYSASGIEPSAKFGLKSSCLIRQSPSGQQVDSARSHDIRSQDEVPSTSAIELESDLEAVTDPAGSTLAQALDPRARDLRRELSDDDSAFTPFRLQGTPRNTALKTSERTLIKEYFAETDPFFFPKGHPVIAFTEDQVSTVLKVVAEETARSTQTMLDEIIKQASKLNLGFDGNRSSPLTTTCAGKFKGRNAGSEQYSDTSGALRSDDELSSIE